MVAVIWVGYIYMTHEEPEKEIQRIIQDGTEAVETAKEKAGDIKEKALELKEDIQEKVDKVK